MKKRTKIILAGIPILAVLAWSAAAQTGFKSTDTVVGAQTGSADEATQTADSEESDQAAADMAAAVERMNAQKLKIGTSLGMSAPMEIDTEGGADPVMDLYNSGMIVNVTLEEVEKAMADAAATPDPEDDKVALDLKHRGSYRFFLPDAPSPAN